MSLRNLLLPLFSALLFSSAHWNPLSAAEFQDPTSIPQGNETLPKKWLVSTPPNPSPDAQWFHTAALGLFQHWGIASGSPHGEPWDMRVRINEGKEPTAAEIATNNFSPEKMFARATIFNPKNYDPERWMHAAQQAGFRYAVLTTRHHDAYFLGKSQFGDWNAGHYIGRDLIEPWVKACRDNGIKVGFYFSGPDWYHGHEYINYTLNPSDPTGKKGPFYNWKLEKVASNPPMPPELEKEITRIAHGEIRELLTNYGKVDLMWPDGGFAGFDPKEAYRLQPGMIIGRGHEYATPEGGKMMKMEYIKEANRRGYPWEFCTIGQSGSWHWSEKAEAHGISAEVLISELAQTRARGGNLLLNIGPRPDGEMPHWFYPLCDELAQWMKTGAEAIYDIHTSGPFPYPDQCAQPITVSDTAWYVFPNYKPESFKDPILIKDVEKPSHVSLLRNGAEVPYDYANRTITLRIPENLRTKLPDVVKIVWQNSGKTPLTH